MTSIHILLLQRLWQAFAGLVTVVLISKCLTPELQGWYYSFLSIIAIYNIFDLGLNLIILRKCAELFTHLHWTSTGNFTGKNADKFHDLIFWAVKHYAILALIFGLLVIPTGYYFFSNSTQNHTQNLVWEPIWIILGLLGASSILTTPLFAIIEGSGSVSEVALVRVIQNILGSLTCWFLLIGGMGLWSIIAMIGVSLMVSITWLFVFKSELIFFSLKGAKKNWYQSENIWPLHWKMGLTTISAYVLLQIYPPILFHYHGAIMAGKLGLSLTITIMLGVLAQSWLSRSVPLITKKMKLSEIHEANQIFKRDFLISTVFLITGAIALITLHILIEGTQYIHRVLSLSTFIALLLTVLISHITNSLGTHLRCFCDEPLVWVTLISSVVTVMLAIYWVPSYGANGVIYSMLFIQCFFTLPLSIYIWLKHNQGFFYRAVKQ